MSNTTVTTRSAAEEAALHEVRRLQEEARRTERERVQLGQAQQRVRQLDSRAEAVTRRLDEAAARLPDLSLRPLEMPPMPGGTAATAVRLDRYCDELEGAVKAYELLASTAIDKAALTLQRRQETARLWRVVADMTSRMPQLHAHCVVMGQHTGEPVPTLRIPSKPDALAELEVIRGHRHEIQALLKVWESREKTLNARQTVQAASARLAGTDVTAHSADRTLQAAEVGIRARAQASLQAHLTAEMIRHNLKRESLPAGLAALVANALTQAASGDIRDLRPEVSVWLAREAAQREGVRHAEQLLQTVPEGVNEDNKLRRRWGQLTSQLQRVMNAMDPMTPSLQREHEQLRADAQRHVNLMLARADWVAVMTRSGCEVLERADGGGLVVIDLDHPDVYLEVLEYMDEHGTFAASLELKADPDAVIVDENAVTEAVCRKLQQASGHSAPNVSAQSEVVERKSQISRGRRPAVRRPMAMQRPLSS